MDREDAIEYLQRKGKIDDPYGERKERKFEKEEEAEIQKVMKQGKIYGDPMVILNE